MKKLLLALALLLLPSFAWAQCNGQFANGQVCGVVTGGPKLPGPVAFNTFSPLPQNQIFVGNASNIATAVAMSQDCTIISTGVITCTRTNNVAFTAIATTVPGTGVVAALGIATNASGGIITPTPTRAGDIAYWNGSAWVTLAGNNSGSKVLQETAAGVPSWVSPGVGNVLQATPTAPAGTASTTGVMMGLGTTCTLTPNVTGRAEFYFQGSQFNSTSGNLTTTIARFGTGTAPANGAALTGTTVGTSASSTAPAANGLTPFFAGGIITGLTLGTALWFDVSVSVNGGTGTINNVSCSIKEI